MKTMTHKITTQKNDTVYKVYKSRKNVNKKVNASITSTKKNIDKVDKAEKPQKPPEAVFTSKNKKNYTVDKVDKPRSIPITNISNKTTQIKKSSEIYIHRDNLSVSVFPGQE